MKDLVNKLLLNIHWFIMAYAAYGAWEMYDVHQGEIAGINAQIPAIELEITENEKKVKEINDFIKKTDEYKVRVEEVAKNIESVQKQLPPDINDSNIITFFQKEMDVLNIKDPSITPGVEVPGVYFITKDYSLKAKGTFLQFLIFFERIGNAARIYNVKSLKLVQASENQRGRFQMITIEGVVQAFRFNPDFKVDRGFDQIESSTPAVAPATANTKSNPASNE